MITRSLFTTVFIVMVVLFTGVPIAYADDCSSASDCSNVVQGTGCFAGCLGLVIGTAAAATKNRWKTRKEKKNFKDCKEAANYIKQAKSIGLSVPKFTGAVSNPKVTQQPDGSFIVETNATFSVDPNSSTMTLPEYTWDKMSKKDIDAINEFTSATRVHEEGHFTVADQVASEFSKTVSGTGTTEAEARQDLQKELNNHREKAQEELDKRAGDDGEYDEATDHGRKQAEGPAKGFPGGKNIALNCP